MELLEKRDDLFTVSVLGEFSSGKSTLINALFLKNDILPVGSGVTTSVPIVITHGDRMELQVIAGTGTKTVKVTGLERIKEAMSKHAGVVKGDISALILTQNNPELQGMRVIDTPGLNAPNDIHARLSENIIDKNISDFVLWTVDLNYGATGSILVLLKRLKKAHHRCVLIANQADKVAKTGGGPQAVQKAMDELKKRAYMFPKIFKSCALDGLRAVKKNDQTLFQKAGMANIFQHILASRQEWGLEQGKNQQKKKYAEIRSEIDRLKKLKIAKQKEIDEFGRDLADFISQKALKEVLQKEFLSARVKKILADVIDEQVDQAAGNHSNTFSAFRILLHFKNEGFPYVNAILAAHITLCFKKYADSINRFIEEKMKGMGKDFSGALDPKSLQPGRAVVPKEVIEDATDHVLRMILALVGGITAAISAFFIQSTVTYLLIITVTVWNPIGIAIAIIGTLLTVIGIGGIVSVPNKLKKNIKKKFGIPEGHGVFDQIWYGGTIDPPEQPGGFSKFILNRTDAGKNLLKEILSPPSASKIMQRKHVEWAFQKIEVSAGMNRNSLSETVMTAMHQCSNKPFRKSNKIPSMENERLHDFKFIWEGLTTSNQSAIMASDKKITGLRSELQRVFIQDIETRIKKLEVEL